MASTQSVLPIAVQLYTLRNLPNAFDSGFDNLLGQVAAIGYRGVELLGDHGLSADQLRALLQKHGLTPCSTHVGLKPLEESFDAIAKFHSAIGNSTLVISSLPQEVRPADAAGWREVGRRLGAIGGRAADRGMQLLYHNHAWEMEKLDGKLALDWMMEAAQPAHLLWEPDLAWIVRGNADPLALLQRYTGRCPRIHVKDLAPAGQNEAEKGFADVGYGTLDWSKLLPAAKAAGGEWYIVEHDMPQDPMRTIRRSYEFLRDHLK